MAKFQVRRASPVDPVSGLLPSSSSAAGTIVAVLGTAYKIASKATQDYGYLGEVSDASAGDSGINTFALADNSNAGFVGFVTKEVRKGPGFTDTEIAFMGQGLTTTYESGEIMTPFEPGKAATLIEAIDLEVESPDNLVTSGAQAVSGSTKAGSLLTFLAGKFALATTSDVAQYKVVSQLTPEESGKVRVYITRVTGAVDAASWAQP
jgi:hypothetical protein